MAQAGTAYVDIQGDFTNLQSQISAQIAPLTSKFGKMGTAAAVGLGAVVVAGVAAGKALYDVGETFDEAYDRIRVGTGATGKALGRLKSDFQATFATVPADAETVSTAITKLNQRLGLTGRPLQRMSAQMIELSRITETDLTTNIETVTRAFGDFGIKAQKQPEYLDRLFRASQKSGVSVDKLADTMVQFGSPLRSLGFDFDEAATMVGKFEKEGVNTRLVMGSMRIALGRMADQGVTNAGKAFEMLTGQIKNAKSPTEATRKAIELFGARAGPDMARAIIEGRFEFGKLVGSIKDGKNSIMLTAEQTRDFNESWTLFKNQVLVVIAPLATKLFNAVGGAMASLTQEMSGVTSKGSGLREFFKGLGTVLGAVFKGIVFAIKGTIFVMKWFIKIAQAIGTALRVSWVTSINAVKTAFTNIGKFLGSLPRRFLSLGKAIGNALKNGIKAGLSALGGVVSVAVTSAVNAAKAVANAVIAKINSLANTVNKVSSKVNGPQLPTIPPLAKGTSNFQGGMALVGEQGPELVNLPRGSKVFTASQTRQIAASGIGSAGAPEVRVFIGDRELTDIVRVEMREKDRAARANYRTGVV
jgi:phage-related minor tail protein